MNKIDNLHVIRTFAMLITLQFSIVILS